MKQSSQLTAPCKPLDAETAQSLFGKRLSAAREKKKFTQQKLAEAVKVSRPVIGTWESGNGAPEPEKAIALARTLDEDQTEFLLLAALQRGASNSDHLDPDLLCTVNDLLGSRSGALASKPAALGLSSHLSLMDSCSAFTPMTILVGDKREDHDPQNAGDLYVFSASTVDDRWIMKLGLPPDTEKISDKTLFTDKYDEHNWLREKLSQRHIMLLGSPASNLFSREYNNEFLFRFAISREAQVKWDAKRTEMKDLKTLAALAQFHLTNMPDLKQTMRLFKPAGFIDFNYRHLRLGMDVNSKKDFAVISLGRNPFAKPDSPYFAILVAGVHHPGTANAVRFLANPSNFKNHPFGGILEVDVPAKNQEDKDIAWHNKIEKCYIDWHHAGSGEDPLAYDPAKLLSNLRTWREKLDHDPGIVTELLTEEEVKAHEQLIQLLASAKSPGEAASKNPGA